VQSLWLAVRTVPVEGLGPVGFDTPSGGGARGGGGRGRTWGGGYPNPAGGSGSRELAAAHWLVAGGGRSKDKCTSLRLSNGRYRLS
jgi:hypothetical protein